MEVGFFGIENCLRGFGGRGLGRGGKGVERGLAWLADWIFKLLLLYLTIHKQTILK